MLVSMFDGYMHGVRKSGEERERERGLKAGIWSGVEWSAEGEGGKGNGEARQLASIGGNLGWMPCGACSALERLDISIFYFFGNII